jgi:hypothetical protein
MIHDVDHLVALREHRSRKMVAMIPPDTALRGRTTLLADASFSGESALKK